MEELLFRGHPEVVDADLADYFQGIPHAESLEVGIAPDRRSARVASDRDVAWIARGRYRRSKTDDAHDAGRETSGAGFRRARPSHPCWRIIMRRFVLGWKMFGLERTLGSRLVTYADDLIDPVQKGQGQKAALQRLQEIMEQS